MAYRQNPTLAVQEHAAPPRRFRLPLIFAASIGAHVVLFGAAFLLQSREPPAAPTTRVVRVLSGTVDESTGSFTAAGLYDARVRTVAAR